MVFIYFLPIPTGAQGKGASGIPRFLSYARRLKVPDFARIHEKAFQRMEGLDDYIDKRKARQDTLGSTTKKTQVCCLYLDRTRQK